MPLAELDNDAAAVSPESIMADVLQAQEAQLQRLLSTYERQPTSRTSGSPPLTRVKSSAPPPTSTQVATLHHSPMATTTTCAVGVNSSPTAAAESAGQHRANVIRELLQRDHESQWAAELSRTAVIERDRLQRAAQLEEERLALAQRKNTALRARLAALTQERREAAQRALHSSDSTALVLAPAIATTSSHPHTQLARTDDTAVVAGDFTNEIVEARQYLDQRTREVQDCQDRLHQLQQYHLDQLSGQFRPLLFAEDALRTTENFLDTETNVAVRATVVDALLEVSHALKPLTASDGDGGDDNDVRANAALSSLDAISTLWDRLAVQNFVVGRINRLFTCMCPTAPPLTLLKETNMM